MTERIDEIESRLREMGTPQPQQEADGDGQAAAPVLRPPETEVGPTPEAVPELHQPEPQRQHATGCLLYTSPSPRD